MIIFSKTIQNLSAIVTVETASLRLDSSTLFGGSNYETTQQQNLQLLPNVVAVLPSTSMNGSFASAEPGRTGPSSGTQPKTKARPPPPPFLLPLNVAFYICLIAHLIAASNAPILDCDETFNYWEPLHYLTHGYGFQTWEYSPDFSIRSWAYILVHAVPTKLVSLLPKSKTFEFYTLRCLLATICAATETRLYSAISRNLNPRIGVFYLMVVALTPGFFYASAAFLPSSFAMYTSTLGLTAFMDWQGGPKTAPAIMFFGIGALLGWPFAGALIIPFVIEDWVVAIVANDIFDTFLRYLDGVVRCLAVLGLQISIDAFFYRNLTIVPWRIVAYNVFGGKDRGPDIFGTEPWHFYVRNLLLNFNLWFLLAMAVAPLLLIQVLFRTQSSTKQTVLRTVTFTTPFYLWFAIFTLQPHKEERFMFPAYPFLALNAAIALHMLLSWFGSSDPKTSLGRIPPQVKLAVVLPIVLLSINIGLLRILGTVVNYQAPLRIYDALEQPNMAKAGDTVCIGKDWYRFPTSFFLPHGVHAKFIKSEFDGLLPGEFSENRELGLFPGTWMVPSGMNDQNQEDMSKYTDIRHCSFLVDSSFPSTIATKLEPAYMEDERWEKIRCEPFLDNAATGLLARTIWLPDNSILPQKYRRIWGEHCLLRVRT
ncbi:mannosyltransferase [Lithohypha guttulata]|nr:mannosyltransferase [Lithohypha guttulata]